MRRYDRHVQGEGEAERESLRYGGGCAVEDSGEVSREAKKSSSGGKAATVARSENDNANLPEEHERGSSAIRLEER